MPRELLARLDESNGGAAVWTYIARRGCAPEPVKELRTGPDPIDPEIGARVDPAECSQTGSVRLLTGPNAEFTELVPLATDSGPCPEDPLECHST